MSALPETWLVHLIRLADEDPEMILVRLAKEEEGVGISAGAHFAGSQIGDAHAESRLPGIREWHRLVRTSVQDSALNADQLPRLAGRTRSVANARRQHHRGNFARAWGFLTFVLDAPETVKKRIRQAQTLAESSLQPVALLLTRDLMWEE